MTRDEENRKLAEWLGWTQFRQEPGFEELLWVGRPPDNGQRRCIPDFYSSESANAMLLEKMQVGIVLYCGLSGKWYCGFGFPSCIVQNTYYADRKAAICAAALALIGKERP